MKLNFSKVAGFLLLIVLGGLSGYLVGKAGASAKDSLSALSLIVLALLFVPLFLFVIGIHEAGHAIAGILVNFDFRMFVIGPFMWEKQDAGWKFKWNKNVNTAGGMVACLPTGTTNLKNRFLVYIAGGPIASLLLAISAYITFRVLSMVFTDQSTLSQIALYALILMAILSAAIFVVTSIPMHAGGFYSDGGRILRLQRGGDTAHFDVLMLKIMSTSAGGTRPADLNASELEEALELGRKLNAPFIIYLHSYAHQANFDRGDYDSAEHHLKEYLRGVDTIPAGIQSIAWLDAAFFYAYARKDLQRATSYWSLFKPSAIIPKAQILAAEAALATLRNETERARGKAQAAIAELPNMIDKGISLALAEKLQNMLAHLDKE